MPETPQNSDQQPDSKRCEYLGEFSSPDPQSPFKICAYKCRGYNAIATFPWQKDQPCPPSFDGNFPCP